MKKIITALICFICIFVFTSCGNSNNQDNSENLLSYQSWENFIYESTQEKKLNYKLSNYNEEPIALYDEFTCGNIYDKNGNIIANYYESPYTTHNWYILEKSNEGDITFNFKSITNAQWGVYSYVGGIKGKVYFTNRILTTDAFDMSGFNFSATNGAYIDDVSNTLSNFHGDHYNDIKDLTYPIRVDSSEFETTHIISCTSGFEEETNWDYCEYKIFKVIITFINNFDKAIVKTYDFSLRFSANSDECQVLDAVVGIN